MKKSKWNPGGVDITVDDMHQIAVFNKIVKNYIKMKNILNKDNPQSRNKNGKN